MPDVVSINNCSLSQGMYLSTTDEVVSILSELGEIGIDSLLDDGLLQSIPIVNVLKSLYKTGKNVRDIHLIKQYANFIISIQSGCSSSQEKEKYRELIKRDQKTRDKQLSYITILLDRYIEYNKSGLLAACFLEFLDNKITWMEFTKFGGIIERLLPGDLIELQSEHEETLRDEDVPDSLLRLVALGLVVSHSKEVVLPTRIDNMTIPAATEKNYVLTSFGKLFLKTIQRVDVTMRELDSSD